MQSSEDQILTGMVKFYKNEEGYGFVSDGEKDYFFNFHAIKGKEMPAVGDEVTFTLSDKKPPKGKNSAIKSLTIIRKAQNKNARVDDRIKCPHCGRKITPRIVLEYGEPSYSLCPYCGGTVKNFKTGCLVIIAIPFTVGLFGLYEFINHFNDLFS